MASLMDQLDFLTRRAWVKSNDQLLRKHSQLSRLLMMRASRDQQTGAKIEFGLRTTRPPVKALADAYDTYPTAGGPTHLRGVLEWADYVVGLQISGKEIRAQHGVNIQQLLKRNSLSEMSTRERSVMMSILTGQVSEGQEALAEKIGTDIYNSTGSVGLTGLQAIIDNSQSDYATLAYNNALFETDSKAGNTTYWEPQVSTNSGTLRELTLELIGITKGRVRRGGEKAEEVVAVCDNDLWTELDLLLQSQKGYVDKNGSALAKVGFDAFEWGFISFMPDERAPANKLYILNMNNLWLEIRPSADENNFEGWEKAPKQDVAYGPIHMECQLVCNDRHRQGLIGDIAGVSD